jgi:hypothetical protein
MTCTVMSNIYRVSFLALRLQPKTGHDALHEETVHCTFSKSVRCLGPVVFLERSMPFEGTGHTCRHFLL